MRMKDEDLSWLKVGQGEAPQKGKSTGEGVDEFKFRDVWERDKDQKMTEFFRSEGEDDPSLGRQEF